MIDDGGAPVAPPSRVRRGGDQVLPRPEGVLPGPPSPWADLGTPDRRLDVTTIRDRVAGIGPPGELADPFVGLGPGTRREAAVLVPVFDGDDGARVVLTRRPTTMPSHRGEVAFPGGGRHADDLDLEATALREAREEVGLDPGAVDVVARLSSLGPTVSGFVIAPFVGLLAAPPVLVADPYEVARVFDVALAELTAPGVHHEELWPVAGRVRSIHVYELEGETVWGATARILTHLLARLLGVAEPGPIDRPR